MIEEFALSIAIYAIASIVYAALIGMMRAAPPRQRALAVGATLGIAAALCVVSHDHVGASSPISDAIVPVGLAGPFGGGLATAIAGTVAAASVLLLDGKEGYSGLAEITVAGLLGVAVTALLRRSRPNLGWPELMAFSSCLALGALVLLATNLIWREVRGQAALALAARVTLGTMVLGTLMQRWSESEARIRERERRWSALVANVPGAVVEITVDAAGEMSFVFATPDAARIFGDGLLRRAPSATQIFQSIHPEDRIGLRRSLVEAGQVLRPWSHEFRVTMPGDTHRWLRGRATPTRTPRGDVVWDAIIVNVTSRKDMEQVLRRSETLHRLLAENTMEVICRIGSDGSFLYVSPSAREILGHEPHELVGRPWTYLVDGADIGRVKEAVASLAVGGPPVTMAYRVRRADGTTIWIEERRRVIGNSGAAEPPGGIGILRPTTAEIAERPETVAENEPASEHQGQFARLLEAASAGIIVIDPYPPGQPIVFANRAATAITGYQAAELLGRNWGALAGPEGDPKLVAEIGEAASQQRPLSTTFMGRNKDGRSYWARLDCSPVRDSDGRVGSYVGVFVDISEQKRVERELRRAREAAEEANQAKSDFIANISHELRTPLNGVIGFTNLLLNENLPAEQRRYATFAHDAGSSLLAIINNILDLSKIEAGKVNLKETDFSVVELAVSCNTVVWHAARERALDLNFVLKPDVMNLVRGDPDRLRQVLLNLLSNAIKFTEKGGVVLTISRVQDLPTGTMLKFSVTDTGIGIAKEQQSRLFQKFSQVEDKEGIYLRGSGLGLAICKNLVEHMGGSIGVISTSGIGSNFWFTVPLRPASGSLKPAAEAMIIGRRGASILLVEDMPMNQELMITLLGRAGHQVEAVGDGVSAVEAVRFGNFDLVLMDVQLPRMDGAAATRMIRRMEGPASDIPIIAMTARALAGDVEQCLAAGMDDYVSKPIDAAALLALIDRWVGVRHATRREAARPETSTPPVQDYEILHEFQTHLGAGKFADLIARVRRELPRALDDIDEQPSNRALIERSAHDLISLAGTAGLMELVECARALMEACRRGNDAEIATAIAALDAAGERALAALETAAAARVE